MLQTVENEKWDPLGPPHSYCMRQLLLYKIGHEKVKIFWKWCFHRWQIPLSLQMRLSKSKQPLSQRKKTSFPPIQPFLLPPFPQLLIHCQFTASSVFSSLWFLCVLFGAGSQPWLLHSYSLLHPLFSSHSNFFLLPLWLQLQFTVSYIQVRDTTLPYKTWFIHTSELINLIAWGFFPSWRFRAKPALLMIQLQIYVQPTSFSNVPFFFPCDNIHLFHWYLL